MSESVLDGLACCRLTEVPCQGAGAGRFGTGGPGGSGGRPGRADDRGADRLAGSRAALAPALTSAHAAGRPVLVAWARTVPAGPVRVLLGGDLAGPRPAYPPGGRAEPLPAGAMVGELAGVPAWLRCTGRADVLTAVPAGQIPPLAGGSLDELVTHLGPGPFAWLVYAEPIGRPAVLAELAALQHRIGVLADRQAGSARDRVELERAQDRHRELSRALTTGLWNVHVLAGGADGTAAARTAALLCAASDLLPLPYTLHPADRPAPLAPTLAAALPGGDLGSSPFAAPVDLVAAIARPPVRELPGIRLVEPPDFDVTPEVGGGIPLGTVLDGAGEPAGRFEVPTATLNRHAFVAGATGAGKSQTVRHLLEGLAGANIPWLVIEPAKSEYARMAGRLAAPPGTVTGDGAELVVIRPGDPDQVAVSLNPLEPEAGFPLQTHLDLVRALFLAAFEANEPFPQVLARALSRCYEDAGWDLALSQPRRTGGVGGAGGVHGGPRYPNLGDLQRVAAEVVAGVGYGPEMTADVRGFVDVRLGSLRLGTPGRFFEGGHPLDVAGLLDRNVVLELEDVGNDQDKAFCIGAVLIRLAEHRRVHHRPGPERLRHVTVVEEAHRLLRAGAAGTPAAHAVELFAALLAEIRSYGEGVVVAEQIPGKLLPDVVKNTALKVLHRLPAADDRDAVGTTMNLDEAQSRHVVTLPPGRAAVFVDGMD
ncbi:MAG TPA: helicase HerA-like domain-containing protein, partial [Mycobacteriales bacterium]|nr:helicase HerA-like domain-containing protein [Mycobacteriales bacterium]